VDDLWGVNFGFGMKMPQSLGRQAMMKSAFENFINGKIDDSEIIEIINVQLVRIKQEDKRVVIWYSSGDDLQDPNVGDDEMGMLITARYRIMNGSDSSEISVNKSICFWKGEYYPTGENNLDERLLVKNKVNWTYEMMGKVQKMASEWLDDTLQ